MHKASGRAVVRLNGKDVYLGIHGTKESKAAYRRVVAKWKAGGYSLSYGIAKTDVSVAMMLVDYLTHCDKHYPKTRGNEAEQSRIAFKYLEPYWDSSASEFGSVSLMAVRDAMLEATGKHGKPLSRSYVNKLVDRIKRAFGWAVSRQIIKADNYTSITALKGLERGRTSARESKEIRRSSNDCEDGQHRQDFDRKDCNSAPS